MKWMLIAFAFLLLGLLWVLIEHRGHTNSDPNGDRLMIQPEKAASKPALIEEAPAPITAKQVLDDKGTNSMGTDTIKSSPFEPKADEIDPAFPRSWFTDEGYSRRDIEDAQHLMRKEGLSGSQLTDPGTIRRYLLPRVTTMVQITNLMVTSPAKSNTPIPFAIEGEVPTPEFNFVRFEFSRQEDLIIIRALGHSAAFTDENLGRPARMLPVKAAGTLDPLPAGTYRISIPELGISGVRTLMVE